jgi:hypothetical protein
MAARLRTQGSVAKRPISNSLVEPDPAFLDRGVGVLIDFRNHDACDILPPVYEASSSRFVGHGKFVVVVVVVFVVA